MVPQDRHNADNYKNVFFLILIDVRSNLNLDYSGEEHASSQDRDQLYFLLRQNFRGPS